MKDKKNQSGFTLLEVMIALVILALASAGLVKVLTENVKNAAHLENRSIAMLIAENKLNEIYAGGGWLETGQYEEELNMSNRKWLLFTNVSETKDPNLHLVTVKVAADETRKNNSEKYYLVTLNGLVGRN